MQIETRYMTVNAHINYIFACNMNECVFLLFLLSISVCVSGKTCMDFILKEICTEATAEALIGNSVVSNTINGKSFSILFLENSQWAAKFYLFFESLWIHKQFRFYDIQKKMVLIHSIDCSLRNRTTGVNFWQHKLKWIFEEFRVLFAFAHCF